MVGRFLLMPAILNQGTDWDASLMLSKLRCQSFWRHFLLSAAHFMAAATLALC